jgi:hypothetical protein
MSFSENAMTYLLAKVWNQSDLVEFLRVGFFIQNNLIEILQSG